MEKVRRLSPEGDAANGLEHIGYSFPDAVLAGDPVERGRVFDDMALAHATIGIWESAPGVVRFESYPFDELCIVTSGSVMLAADDGSESFAAGDVFLVAEGWRGEWRMAEPLRKFYVELKR